MPTRTMAKGGIEGIVCDVVSGANNGDDDERLTSNKKVAFTFNEVERKGLMKNGTTCRREMCSSDESPSSSIGKNSDLSDNRDQKPIDGEEVQSSYKSPLDAMEALEEVLPIRRGISRFYNGKSKSYASLADASSYSSSIKDVAKPENPYTRKRRNLLACSLAWDKTRNSSPLRGNNGGGISKRAANNATKTTLALALAMSQEDDNQSRGRLNAFASSTWRSFSMVDLQQCASTTNQLAAKPSQLGRNIS